MSVNIDPTVPADSETPRLGAQRIRLLTSELLQLFGFTGATPESLANPPFTVDASGNATLNGQPLTVNNPTVALGVANKQYVDSRTQSFFAGIATGTNTLVVTLAPVPASQAALYGTLIVIENTTANTGPVTLNANGLGAQSVLRGGDPLVAGDLPAGGIAILSWDGTEYQLLSGIGSSDTVRIYKGIDQAVTSSTTLVNDTALAFTIGLNESWEFNFSLHVNCAPPGGSAGGIDVTLTLPVGASIAFTCRSVSGVSNGVATIAAGTKNTGLSGSETAQDFIVDVEGIIINGGTDGTAQLQWCQHVSSSQATTVKAGSNLLATRVNP